MKNPWEEIELSDYENHMKLDSVKQLQFLNVMMKNQFNSYLIKTVMILGIAGGNGLEHINTDKIQKVYGIDINHRYLEKCIGRYGNLNDILECIGYQCFQNVIMQIRPLYVSCIIQINTNDSFVSDSPYIHVFDGLNEVHHQMQEDELNIAMKNIKYYLISRKEQILPNRKILVQLDYRQ